MAKVIFEADNPAELAAQMRKWLAGASGASASPFAQAMEATSEATSELAKTALGFIAQAAPEPVSSSEIFKRLTALGYEVSDSAQKTLTATLDAMADGEGGEGIIDRVDRARDAAIYEMSQAVARGVLRIIGL